MQFNDLGQIRFFFDHIGSEHIYPHNEDINTNSEDWLLEKQQSYKGDEYVEQLEENNLYFVEATLGCAETITRYLCQGKPWVKNTDEFTSFHAAHRRYYGKINQQAYLDYIQHGTNPQPRNPGPLLLDLKTEFNIQPIKTGLSPEKYQGLHHMRKQDMLRYIDEQEFSSRYYHAALSIAEAYLSIFFQMNDVGKSAALFSLEEVLEVVIERVNIQTRLCLHLISFQLPEN